MTDILKTRLLTIFFVFLVLLSRPCFAGSPPIHYAATIHPLAEIIRELVGSRGQVIRLLRPGVSPHTFEPTPSEVKMTNQALALFYAGPGLDKEWAVKLPAPLKIEVVSLLPSAFSLPMPLTGHSHQDEVHDPEKIRDPHFWTDPLAVRALLPMLVETLALCDPPGRATYEANSAKFAETLTDLDRELAGTLKPLAGTPLFLFHPSFQYLFKRYGLNLGGVIENFPGQEPSPRSLVSLVKEIKSSGVATIFSEPQLSRRPAMIIAEAAGVSVQLLDPVGGDKDRMTYADLLRYNAAALGRARP